MDFPPWAPSESIAPEDGPYQDLEYESLISKVKAPGAVGATTWGDYCSMNGLGARAAAACADRASPRPWRISLAFASDPLERRVGGIVPFEYFGSGWSSVRVDPELGRRWTELAPMTDVDLRYPVSPHSLLAFRMGLRRDLSAWREDPIGSNLPLDQAEVDLNEPSLGYFRAEDAHFAFTIGRFPEHWSPSPEFGLALSRSVPYHNGAEFALKSQHLRYRFLASSLNPWLEGTPPGGGSSEDYPPGSEEYRQRHYGSAHGAGIFHQRVYDARIKTLFAHRIEGEIGPFSLGFTETEIIGGKTPDLRDAGPFIVFHNDFKEGYANGSVGLDAVVRLPGNLKLFGEYYIDDVDYDATEKDGNTASLQGWMVGVRHAFGFRGWLFGQSLHAIRTDPYLYGYLQPLNTMASRIILSSNHQGREDSLYVDKYVIDYPIGYIRGGDAFDFWYRIQAWRGPWHALFAAAILAKGEVGLSTPYETYYGSAHDSPTGVAEREARLLLEGDVRLPRGFGLRAGTAWQSVRNANHVSGAQADRLQATLGASWRFPR